MSARSALLDAVLANPEDDEPRLVFADWYEEHGDPERAELIRAQCELAGLPWWADRARVLRHRVRVLLARHGRAWVAELGSFEGVKPVSFERGFLNRVRVSDLGALVQAAPGLRARAPVDRVDVVADPPPEPVAGDLGWVRHLALTDAYDFDAEVLERLATSSLMAGLRSLDLAGSGIENEGAEVLARAGVLGRIETLDLSNCFVGAEGAATLLDAGASSLRALRFGSFGSGYVDDPFVTDATLEALAAGRAPRLRELVLDGSLVTTEGVRRLLGSHAVPDLEVLSVRFCNLDGSLVDSAAVPRDSGPSPIRLKSLQIGGVALGSADLSRLEQLSQLEQLDVAGAHLEDEALAGLATLSETVCDLRLGGCRLDASRLGVVLSRPWPRLHSLDLTTNDLGPESGPVLARAALPALRDLVLTRTELKHGFRALADASWLPGIERLDASQSGLEADDVAVLVQVRGLQRLALSTNALGAGGLDRLRRLPAHALTDLDVSGTHVTGDRLVAFLTACDLPELLQLEVCNLKLEPEHAEGLARAGLSALQVLNAQACRAFGRDGMRALGGLRSLRDLRIAHCDLKDPDVVGLIDDLFGGRLERLQHWGNRFSADTQRVLESVGPPVLPAWFDENPPQPDW
ncbi:MAG: TIGR02996 domain-containing protein [Myxococcota bacterium]